MRAPGGLALSAVAAAESAKERLKCPAEWSEAVFDARRSGGEHAPLQEPGVDKLGQAGRERRGRDRSERTEELVEALGSLNRDVQDRERPPPFEEARRTADLLGDRFR